MKKRNRANHRRSSLRQFDVRQFGRLLRRKRKSYSFEHLEQRLAFTATPLETTSLSNDTPEGAAAILMRELQWAALQSAAAPNIAFVPMQLPGDPFFPNPATNAGVGQWHLWNIGQEVSNPDFQHIFGVPGEDINVIDVWQGLGFNDEYTGDGVLIAVIDNGMDVRHPDLAGNIHPSFRFNALNGSRNVFPDIYDEFGQVIADAHHGTAVAGLIAATWDVDGNPSIGGVGVAPEATIIPILMVDNRTSIYDLPTDRNPIPIGREVAALRYAMMVGADITNNSWGPPDNRTIAPSTDIMLDTLRDSVIFGRGGLGMINIFASGNGAANRGSLGFPGTGTYDSSAFDGILNSRYVITVTGVDHDGKYMNSDGSWGTYAEAGANVLVAAPTGNNAALDIANDDGQGSGIWTTDLIGNFGANAEADPITGIDDDRDFLDDPNYTSRFNGTSAATPLVSGVIALMLEANPNLTYRDVQEILVRSARQTDQYELPSTETTGGEVPYSSWQTNQMRPFRDPDAWDIGVNPFIAIDNPLADPTLTDIPYAPSLGIRVPYLPEVGNDLGRLNGHYELQPGEFTNGAGYTVSQGFGLDQEVYGYGHGVIDAELAVRMAEVWHTLKQNIAPNTEKTYTTFRTGTNGSRWLAAEQGSDDTGDYIVPGGVGGDDGYIAFWEEYFADPPAPFDPANSDSWPANTRGFSYSDFAIPVNQQINVEWVELKVQLSGPGAAIENLKINITSPSGMQSELNPYYLDTDFELGPTQTIAAPATAPPFLFLEPGSDVTDGDTFVWTFASNRHWGESTNGEVIIDSLTGEPVAGPGLSDGAGGYIANKPIRRDWELHLENWSTDEFNIDGIEIVFHGKPIAGGALDAEWLEDDFAIPVAQRIQGTVGIDVNEDDEFSGIDPNRNNEWNSRYIQEFVGFNPAAPRAEDLERRVLTDYDDVNGNGILDEGDVRRQEPYAENVLVEAYRYTPGATPAQDIVETQPIAQFLTGADGNYYFDLVPGNYIIRATDLNDLPATTRDDPNTPLGYRMHYQEEWRINADWFYAPDRDATIDISGDSVGDIPGEIFQPDRNEAPTAFRFANSAGAVEPRIPAPIKDLNFLLKPNDSIPTPPNTVVVNGTVYADVNANAAVDLFDGPAGNMRVYVDSIRNGVFDPGEQFVTTNSDGSYSIAVPTVSDVSFVLGVALDAGWVPSVPGGDQKLFFNGPGDVLNNQNFFLNPPDDPTGSGLGNITGFVFDDIDGNGTADPGENGLAGITVFIDTGAFNGVLDPGEISVVTAANGGYFIPNLTAGTYRVDVVSTPEQLQTPEFRTVTLASGETRIGVAFGLQNLAFRDFGDLPASFDVNGFPNHVVVSHFRLGETVDGEVAASDGGDDASDDGVEVLSNSGVIKPGENRILVQVSGVGGRLTGWIDWNGNGSFQSNEQITFFDADGNALGIDADLSPSPTGQELRFNLPEAPAGSVAARFRWGEVGLDLDTESFIGEVEDYLLPSASSIVSPGPPPGDFNLDGGVNAADYVMLRKFLGSSAPSSNGSGSSGTFSPADLDLWQTNFGTTASAVPSTQGDANQDGNVNAADAVVFRKFMGSTIPLPGSSTPVGPGDLDAWQANFGATVSAFGDSPAASATPGAASAADDSSTSSAFTPFFVALGSEGDSTDSFSSSDQGQSQSGSSSSMADALLLLDQAIADLDDRDADTPLNDRKDDGDIHDYDDLALAAAFEDESAWWSL